ncbi:MAG TPA: hypothetical protein VIF02_09680, partial [Methylocella sp.]
CAMPDSIVNLATRESPSPTFHTLCLNCAQALTEQRERARIKGFSKLGEMAKFKKGDNVYGKLLIRC